MLIAFARPDASYVCGFRAWLELGYQVGNGEKAIWILAKRAILHRMRPRLIATSVLAGGV